MMRLYVLSCGLDFEDHYRESVMLYRIRRTIYEAKLFQNLPNTAKIEYLKDHLRLPRQDIGIDEAIDCGVKWLSLAQDKSSSADGGVSEFYSLITGWGPSYPETTGYIIPTMLEYASRTSNVTIRNRAKRMLDWLVSIQFLDGSFQGGNIYAQPCVPTDFNTGQILLGLAAGVKEFGDEYREPMKRAADWLVTVQDDDGAWRKYNSPFVSSGEKTYLTHVAWGLLEAARLESTHQYAEAGLAHVRWALRHQLPNGWFRNCCLTDSEQPLTHTLAYALRGVLEAYRFSDDLSFLCAGAKTADSLLRVMRADGFIPGRLSEKWQGTVHWACLTGTVQIAHCWLMLYQFTDDVRYRNAGFIANRYVRRLMQTSGAPEKVGGIKGAFPIDGAYHHYNYINWGCKFFVDSHMLEKKIRSEDKARTR